MQVTLPAEVLAAAQAAAATFHGQSQQFSVRLMTTTDGAEAADQPLTTADGFAARGSRPDEGSMQSAAHAQLEPQATSTHTPHGISVTGDAVKATDHLPASPFEGPQASSQHSPTANTAQDNAEQPQRAVRDQPDHSSHSDSTRAEDRSATGREQQTLLASDEAEAERRMKPPAYDHPEL
jgi:hypothetical protein